MAWSRSTKGGFSRAAFLFPRPRTFLLRVLQNIDFIDVSTTISAITRQNLQAKWLKRKIFLNKGLGTDFRSSFGSLLVSYLFSHSCVWRAGRYVGKILWNKDLPWKLPDTGCRRPFEPTSSLRLRISGARTIVSFSYPRSRLLVTGMRIFAVEGCARRARR